MTKRASEENIFVLNEKNEQERYKIDRISKTHWVSDYALDIFMTMKTSELRRRPMLFLSKQIHLRPKLLELCQLVTQEYKLSRSALHLAIYYLDRFVDHYNIRQDKLNLVALTCIHIAAQIENTEAQVPRYSEMNRMVKNSFASFEFKAVERKVLSFFNFELIRPTTATFVELFACSFMTREDFAAYDSQLNDYQKEHVMAYPRYSSFEHMLAELAQLLLQMADNTLSINSFGNEAPSLLAASCIAAVRQVSGLPTLWTPYLVELTSYTENQVAPFLDILSIYYYYQTATFGRARPGTPVLIYQEKQEHDTHDAQDWPSPDSGFEDCFPATVDSKQDITMVGASTEAAVQPAKANEDLEDDEPPPAKRMKRDDNEYP